MPAALLAPALLAAFTCGTFDPVALQGGVCAARPVLPMSLVSTTQPIEVHYSAQDAALAATVLAAAETSWVAQVSTLGFPAPLPDLGQDGPEFDLYILESTSIPTAFFCAETYEPTPTAARYSGFVLLNPLAYQPTEVEAAVAHELNHGSQYAIDGLENPSFFEWTSNYVMHQIFPSNLPVYGTYAFQDAPQSSLDLYSQSTQYQYGGAMFLFWLVDNVNAGDDAVLSALWQTLAQPYDDTVFDYNEPDSLDGLAALATASGTTFDEMYLAFAADRWFTGNEHDGTFIAGADYGEIDLERSLSWDQLPQERRDAVVDVSEYGASYIRVTTAGAGADDELTFTLDADATKEWAVIALRPGATGVDRETVIAGATGTATIGDLDRSSHVVFIVANLGDGTHDPDRDDYDGSNFAWSIDRTGSGGGDGAACGCRLEDAGRPTRASGVLLLIPALAFLLLRAVLTRRDSGSRDPGRGKNRGLETATLRRHARGKLRRHARRAPWGRVRGDA